MDIYLLWHCFTDERGENEMMLGVYSSSIENAQQGLALLSDKPGFRDYPDGFAILKGRMNEAYLDIRRSVHDLSVGNIE
jgi:hypothetical protein